MDEAFGDRAMYRSAGDDGDAVTVSVAGRDGLNDEEAMERAKAVMIALTAFGRRSGGPLRRSSIIQAMRSLEQSACDGGNSYTQICPSKRPTRGLTA